MAIKAKVPKRSARSRRRARLIENKEVIKASDRELLGIPQLEWATAKRKERIVKKALRSNVEAAADFAGCSARTIRRLVASYRIDPSPLAFLPRRPGPKPGSQRLDLERESIVAEAVEHWKASPEPLPVERAVEEVRRLAKAAGMRSVARNTVALRIWNQGEKSTRKRVSKERIPSEIPRTRRALGIAQADHTPIDLIVVDDINRLPIGRPWITVIFDVASRAVLGFHATLEAPSATSVAMALGMACLPKNKRLKDWQVDLDWPMYGIPDVLHLDNAGEFHSEALRRGCERYGIRLEYRPRGKVHTGGHIERYLGTLMRRIHGVPGTTMSSVKDRGRYKSEERASLTLRELEAWLALEIGGRYHNDIHRGIHMTPHAAWKQALGNRPIPAPANPERLELDFLPVITRKISRSGFQLFHIRYWDPLLSRLFSDSQRHFVRYDPRNLARVWVPIPNRSEYLAIPYADLRRPPISQSEQQAAMRQIQATGRRTVNEDAIFSAIEIQRQLIDRALSKTKARRLRARRPAPTSAPERIIDSPSSGSTIDFSKPVVPFPSETWSS
jgi:putative transposase